jgi:hypothetical protein
MSAVLVLTESADGPHLQWPVPEPVHEVVRKPQERSNKVDGISWIAEQLELSKAQKRRLARPGKIPGVYHSRKRGRRDV